MQSIIHIREAYTSIASNNLNRTIKILTTLTVLIMLPSLFYGMYGMNIDLPFQSSAWAFAGLIIFTILVNILVVVVARRKRIF